MDEANPDPHAEALAALVAFSTGQNELSRLFARRQGMHATDAAAIVQIIEAEERGIPLTPARLGERIALTSGATSILLNRLEEAGHIRRVREHADRRMVTLHSTAEIQRAADAFFEPLSAQLTAVLSGFDEGELDTLARVARALSTTVDSYVGAVEPAPQAVS